MSDELRRNTFAVTDFVYWVQRKVGTRVPMAARVETIPDDTTVFCFSEVVQWAAAQTGVYLPTGADNQIAYMEDKNRLIPVEKALRMRGAVLWFPRVVAVSLGFGRVVGCSNGRVVIVRDLERQGFQKAARVPGIRYF